MDDIEILLRAHTRWLQARLGRDGMLREMRACLGIDDAAAAAARSTRLRAAGNGDAASGNAGWRSWR
jgi:hypothetical protein